MKLYDYCSAVFNPQITTDLQYPEETKKFIGKRLYWQASWMIEEGTYKDQFAMCVQVTSDEERTPFIWVPEVDLSDVIEEDGDRVHSMVMSHLSASNKLRALILTAKSFRMRHLQGLQKRTDKGLTTASVVGMIKKADRKRKDT